MKKIALFVGICGVLTVAAFRASAETGDSADGSDEIAQLKKQISSLDERIKSIEKRLDDCTIITLTPPVERDGLSFRVPGIIPRQQRLPRGSVRREFNGIPFYIVPINQDAK